MDVGEGVTTVSSFWLLVSGKIRVYPRLRQVFVGQVPKGSPWGVSSPKGAPLGRGEFITRVPDVDREKIC